MATTREVREREQFEEQMARNTARLLDFAKPYTGQLTSADRGDFLERAIAQAWERRAAFAPTESSLLVWWGECLRAAANSRRFWHVIDHHNYLRTVAGIKLGNGEL